MKSYGLDVRGSLFIQEVDTLPTFTSTYEKRLVYVNLNKHLYYGISTGWIDLYQIDSARITSIDATKINGTISASNLPSNIFGTFISVEDEEERFSLLPSPTGSVLLGDTIIQRDNGILYYVIDLENLDNESGYTAKVLYFDRLNFTDLDSPVTLTSSDCLGLNTFTNTGATAEVVMLLPNGQDGNRINFIVTSEYNFTITAQSTETIRYMSTESILGGFIQSAIVGNQVQLDWSGTQWVASIMGDDWNLETS
jgi:hypothetical protein